MNKGTILEDRYRIEKLLSEGGMGEIYIATDSRLNIKVAIKTILSKQRINKKLIQLFKSEAKRHAQLQHEAIPQIKDFFPGQRQYFIVMEFIEGVDLKEELENSKDLPELEKVLDWADQVLDALEYIHSRDVIHRDIKPANLKLTLNNRVKILDFGIAKGTIDDMTVVDTKTTVAASASYASIEQGIKRKDWFEDISAISDTHKVKAEELRGLKSEVTEDIYSFGATLYQLLTKSLPLQANRRAIGIWNKRSDEIKPITALNPKIPQEIAEVIMLSLAFERKNRPQTATEMRRLLQDARYKYIRGEEEKLRQQEIDKIIQVLNEQWNNKIETLSKQEQKKRESKAEKYQNEINKLKKLHKDREEKDAEEIKNYSLELKKLSKIIKDQTEALGLEASKRKSAEQELSFLKEVDISNLQQKNEEVGNKFLVVEEELKHTKDKLAFTQYQLIKSNSNLTYQNNVVEKLRHEVENQKHEINKIKKIHNDSEEKDAEGIRKYYSEFKEISKIISKQTNAVEIEKAKRENAQFEFYNTQVELSYTQQLLTKSEQEKKGLVNIIAGVKKQLEETENNLEKQVREINSLAPPKSGFGRGVLTGSVLAFLLGLLVLFLIGFSSYENVLSSSETNIVNTNNKNQNFNSTKSSKSVPTVTATPTAIPTLTPKPTKYTISEIPANIESVRLFEDGKEVSSTTKTYETKFTVSKTRYVWVELNISHPSFDDSKNIELTYEWYRNGKRLDSHKETPLINSQITSSSFTSGYGNEETGSYNTGKYEILIRYKGEIIASKTFDMVKNKN